MLLGDTKQLAKNRKAADIKRKQLTELLAKPIFPKGISGKYPLHLEAVNTTVQFSGGIKDEKAIDVMNTALENYSKVKMKSKPLYKQKQNPKRPTENGVVKVIQRNKKQKKKSACI